MEMIAKLKPSLRKTPQKPQKDESIKAVNNCKGEKFQANKENSPHQIDANSSSDMSWDFVDIDPLSTPASLSHSYNLEWEFLFNKSNMMKKLKERAMEGNLRSSRFRSVVWKIFLQVLPSDISDWIERTRMSRNKFEELKNHLIVNPRKAMDSVDIKLNNPLSQDEESPWNKFFQDNELRLTIKQDVIRTYPKIEFFQSNQLRNLMVDILFVFAKENPDISYRQGMHELLAPLIFVLHCDHQAYLHACEIESVLCRQENVMKEVLDPAFLEHDAYAMFCKVMAAVEPWYLSKDIFYSGSKNGSWKSLEHINATPFSKSPDLNPASVIVIKLSRIQGSILKRIDPVLHKHLEQMEILPQIYGIRWLRLLFGREFPMHDLLLLWDAIFGDGTGFDLVDYIFVAMLLYLRDILLASDYAVCLTVLMKFPPVLDVHYFVLKALWMREPNHYPEPPNYTHQGSIRASSSSSMDSSTENMSEGASQSAWKSQFRQLGYNHKRQNNVLGGFSSFSRKFSRPRTLSVPKSSSEPMNLQTDISPDLANNPIGSTVSLSHVEESMYRNIPSTSGFAQLEASNLRSAQSSPGFHHSATYLLTPDDVSMANSPTQSYSLPGKHRDEQQPTTKLEREQLEKILHLQRELNDKNSMCRYCSSKLDVTIGRLQQDLVKQSTQVDDIMVSLAGLKLVRDILNGTVRYSQKMATDDDAIQTNDYYCGGKDNPSVGIASPACDKLLKSCISEDELKRLDRQSGKQFYLSSEDKTSPDFLPPEDLAMSLAGRIKGNNSVELNDLRMFQARGQPTYSKGQQK